MLHMCLVNVSAILVLLEMVNFVGWIQIQTDFQILLCLVQKYIVLQTTVQLFPILARKIQMVMVQVRASVNSKSHHQMAIQG